jgi:Flp pilus assembly protein TadD
MIRRAARAKNGHGDIRIARALAQRAAGLARAGRHSESVAVWEELNRKWPGNGSAAAGLGLALLAAERTPEALVWLCAACAAHPHDAALLRLQAQALLASGLRGQAIGALYMALDLEPGAASTHAGLAIALFQEGRPDAALPHCVEAFRLEPSPANVATLSCVFIDLGQFESALAVTQIGVVEDGNGFKVLLNRSIALHGLGRAEEAIAAAVGAMALAPDSAVAKHHLAAALLGAGELTEEAWTLYESRAGLAGAPAWPAPARRWTGEDVSGRRVLLHAEQGLGDTLQFVRYAPLVAARGARVLLAVQPPLVRLLQGTPGVEAVVPVGNALPDFDLYCPLLSLPGLFATSLETIPPGLPYAIHLPPMPQAGGKLRVGLVWAGNPTFADDRKRSIPAAVLGQLAGVPGVVFHSLQFGAESLPFAGMEDALADSGDFADTAAAIAGLDLVIAVDTAVAHLAATMGKPVWVLSRFQGCWRWLQDRDDSPWYPSVRLYRQAVPNDWDGVIGQVRNDLAALAAEPMLLAA